MIIDNFLKLNNKEMEVLYCLYLTIYKIEKHNNLYSFMDIKDRLNIEIYLEVFKKIDCKQNEIGIEFLGVKDKTFYFSPTIKLRHLKAIYKIYIPFNDNCFKIFKALEDKVDRILFLFITTKMVKEKIAIGYENMLKIGFSEDELSLIKAPKLLKKLIEFMYSKFIVNEFSIKYNKENLRFFNLNYEVIKDY